MFILLAAKKHINKGIMTIKVRQPTGLTANMHPATSAQEPSHPLIGPTTTSTGGNNSPLSQTVMDTNWQTVYPVGSIYINATDSSNPSDLIGFGTWEAFGKGRILVGHNDSQQANDSPAVGAHIVGTEGPSSSVFSVIFKNTHQFAIGQRVTLSGISGMAGVSPNDEWTVVGLGSAGGQPDNKAIKVLTPGLVRDGGAVPTLSSTAAARFAGSSFTSFSGAADSGKGFDGNISHKLTVSEMPNHRHGVHRLNGVKNDAEVGGTGQSIQIGESATMGAQGNDRPHNNLAPYITAYIWRRTA